VTAGTRIRDLELVGHRRRDERERMTADVHVRDRLLDFRHVTRHAVAPCAAARMVGMVLERRGMWSVWRRRAVAGQADITRWLDQQRVIRSPVRVVATEAGDTAAIHHARDEIVALHPILVSSAVRKMRERRFTELVLFEPPEVFQLLALIESHGPVVVTARDRVAERLPLRMTLDARIVRSHEVQLRRIDDVCR